MNTQSKLTILGTCSGTEPMPGRHHTSFTLLHDQRLYWFDAGESCSYTAHLSGIDMPATEAIFISHTHMDHIGGLPNLLWTLRKLATVSEDAKRRLANREIRLLIPDMDVFEGLMAVMRGTEGGFQPVFDLVPALVTDGIIYEQHGLRVQARHNFHLGPSAPFKSYSFRIEAGPKTIVYSGDVKSIQDIDGLIDGADLLLMETGHHKVDQVCQYLKDSDESFDKLVFLHHGRAILADPARELATAQSILGDKVQIADDGMELHL